MRRFEFADSSSNKFWEVEQEGSDLNVRWGKIGTQGQSQTKSFADEAKCTAAMDKLIAEKTGKGYVEVGAAPAAPIGKSAPKPAAQAKPASALPAPEPVAPQAAPEPVAVADPSTTPPWLAHGAPLSISRKIAAAALPSRRFPKPVPQIDVQVVLSRLFECGGVDPDVTDADLRPALVEAWQRMKSQNLDGSSLLSDAVLLSFANCLSSRMQGRFETPIGEQVLDALARHKGLEHCVDAFIEMQRMQPELAWAASRGMVSVTRKVTKALASYDLLSPVEAAMRRQLSSAPEALWQVCADKIERAIDTVHDVRKAALAVQLPERLDLSRRLARELESVVDSSSLQVLLLTASDPVLAERLDARYATPVLAATILQERGVEASEMLKRFAVDDMANEALTQIGTPDAIKALVEAVSIKSDASNWRGVPYKTTVTRLLAALQQWPLAGMAGLAELGEQRGKVGEVTQSALMKLVFAHADAVPGILPWVSPAAQALLQRLHSQSSIKVEEAAHGDLPAVLASPPWLRPRKKAVSAMTLQPLQLAAVEGWSEGEREEWLRNVRGGLEKASKDIAYLVSAVGFYYSTVVSDAQANAQAVQAIKDADPNAFAAAWKQYKNGGDWRYINPALLTVMPGEMGAAAWNLLAYDSTTDSVAYVLAKFGLPALPGFEIAMQRYPAELVPLANCFGSVGLAAPMARAATKLKKVQAEARQWLLRFPEHAICGLVAPALGKAGESRDCALTALRFLQAQGHGALIIEVAARYDDPLVVTSVQALLDEDPLERLPAKLPKLPDFWAPQAWRRPVLNASGGASAGKAVPNDALDHIGTMLMFPTVDGLYPGIEQLKGACTAESLADFSWDCFTAWLSAGGNSKEGWAMTALGFLGTDDTARKLTPYIRTWPGESAHARAVTALDVLADIGTDVALMLLNGIAQKVKFKGLQDKAREKIDKIAEARDLTTEELEDRLAPDLGLDDNGSVLLDFGPRQFRVGFDEALKPYVRDSEGTRLADLPKPKKSDDETLAPAAAERFKLLKKDARTIASQQVTRLEWAMCSRRRWLPEHFRQFLAEHPLVRHLVQRLVWGVYAVEEGEASGGKLLDCFRVAEDGSYTTGEDDSITLPEGGHIRIGLPHALELPPETATQFGQLFADYELLQPFVQLGRDTYALGAEEQSATKLERWKGIVVPTGRVLGLVNKGWRRGQAQDGGGIWYFQKPVTRSKVIELTLNPGIIVGMVDEYPEQTLEQVSVGAPSSWGEIGTAESMNVLDPIATSELIRDLESLKA
jgi:predicted DNA-binding WGR domain protein